MSHDPDDLTADEVVAALRNQVTAKTLANWRSQGKGPPYRKVGNRPLYPRLGFMNWLADQEVAHGLERGPRWNHDLESASTLSQLNEVRDRALGEIEHRRQEIVALQSELRAEMQRLDEKAEDVCWSHSCLLDKFTTPRRPRATGKSASQRSRPATRRTESRP